MDTDVPQNVVKALHDCLDDESAQVRQLAIEALGQVDPDLDGLVIHLQRAIDDPDATVRVAAAITTLRIDPQLPAAREPVLAAIRERHPQLIRALGELGPSVSWAAPAVRELVTDPEPQIRELAKLTLSRIQDDAP